MSTPQGPPDRPADAVADAPGPAAAPGAGPGPAGPRRLRVTQRDLDMYAALVGVPRALLIPAESPTGPSDQGVAGARASVKARTWQTLTRSFTRGLSVHLGRPDVPAWFRRMSRHARLQLRQARLRLTPRGGTPRE